ncbi:MAG: TlpA family protein disulfide reductase [Betaproteobacteria bacterium]|nr:TlpA family protein disulfide reductase [Betaproteobacteria bacterium]
MTSPRNGAKISFSPDSLAVNNPAIKVLVALAFLALGVFAAVLARPAAQAPEARFITLSGETFTTSDLRGKVTVVNFWATWCPDCMREMPRMIEAHRRFSPRGYETVAVAVKDHPNRVADYAQKAHLPFKVALDTTDEVARRFGNIHITPTTFVIDKNGRVVRRFVGEPDWREFDRVVEKALAG